MKLGRDYKLRDSVAGDHGLIRNSWIRNTGTCLFARGAHKWATHQHDRISRLFLRDTVRIRVACALDDEDEIFGFIVAEPQLRVVHFVYVKAAYHRWGVGSALYDHMMGPGPCVITQYSLDISQMRAEKKLPHGMTYNPYWFEEQ